MMRSGVDFSKKCYEHGNLNDGAISLGEDMIGIWMELGDVKPPSLYDRYDMKESYPLKQ